jgi:hypothetical protein
MIAPELFLWIIFGYLTTTGILNILLAICQSEHTYHPKYGIIDGIAGLIVLCIAIVMVVL